MTPEHILGFFLLTATREAPKMPARLRRLRGTEILVSLPIKKFRV
jgi:hypothetical protein